ncbi:transglycosylase domain-containing protein [Streptomyces tsukubensis]|uniref:Penicillin-binding protein n=1 Tax=Streptomyces tsukubensis TaxID=83656 RepID=A0A1V4AD48_9ACTN|nr:transglycosylase domain-containing protein [Streptomyces tsukubensis]OON81363.1 penicillin-binding protein [Streptomyces tsukubensis]QFR95514.1 penicillin-binding protein [Streptomyces tsukubensis]
MGRADVRRAQRRGARRSAGGRPSGIRRVFTWKKVLGTLFGLCLLGMAALVGVYFYVDVPEANAEAQLQSNVYKYSDGSVLARTGTRNREIVGLDRIPKDVQKTFVAAENKSFYTDKGVDLKGTARGVLSTVSGKGKQGGSTITQQYVKNYYLTQDQTVSRKLKELVISLKVDNKYSKDDILAGYINTSYYGRGAYGIQAAAQAYYGIDADELNVQQGAYLAALLQAPSQYDWSSATPTGKRLATERWNYVLDNMVKQNWLDSGKRAGLAFPKPQAPKAPTGLKGQTGYLVNAANSALEKQLVAQGTSADDAKAKVDAGGWVMTLNIDKKKQRQLEKSVAAKLTNKLDPKSRAVDADVQAGAVSVSPKSGKVLALYGGKDFLTHQYSNATRADYQPASTFKPLIFASALENNSTTQDGKPITANTIYDGTSERKVKGSRIAFDPPNEDGVDYGDVNVQKAMNKSINSVFAQMGVDVGMENVMETAGKLGMDTKGLPAVPAQTLGSMGASPLQMAGVYATLDNHGKKVSPAIVSSAEHAATKVDFPDPIGEQVVDRRTADSVTSVLTGVVDDGTGSAVRNSDQDVAGKTGTSDSNKSAWFTGYTPDLVTSVGLFGEAQKAQGKIASGAQVTLKGAAGGGRVNGGGFPAEIWAAYTFDAMGEPTKFKLDTEMGAAVAPPPDPTPSTDPSPTTPEPDPSPTSPTPTPTPSTSQPSPPTPTPTLPTAPPTPSTSTSEDPGESESGEPDEPGLPGGGFWGDDDR